MSIGQEQQDMQAELVRLQKLAYTDFLTGLQNRRALQQAVTSGLLKQAIVIVIDLDHLKLINDTYGHQCGDEAIVKMARYITVAFPEISHIYRIGGDEFIVLLESATHKQAYNHAKELLRLCQQPFTCCDEEQLIVRKMSISASIGIAHYQQSQMSFEEALARADEMAYVAKSNGRNRIEMTLTPTIESLPIITSDERLVLQNVQRKPLKIGYFDMLSEAEQYYFQFLTEFLGLKIELHAVDSKLKYSIDLAQFDCLINVASIVVTNNEALFSFVPFEISPLILSVRTLTDTYGIEKSALRIGIPIELYSEAKKSFGLDQNLVTYPILDHAIQALKTNEIQGIITACCFLKLRDLQQMSVPAYRQENSNVTRGIAINNKSDAVKLIPIIRKYLRAGGQSEFKKQTQNMQSVKKRIQSMLTEEEKDFLVRNHRIRVLLQRKHGKLSRYNENLQCYTGLAVRLTHYLEQVLDITCEPVYYKSEQRSSVLESLEKNIADLSFGLFMPGNRKQEYEFFQGFALSLPFTHTAPVLVTTPDYPKLSKSHLSQLTIGVLSQSYTRAYIERYHDDVGEIRCYEDRTSITDALYNYEIQAMILNEDTAYELLEHHPLRIEFQFPNHVERVLCTRESDDQLIRILNKALIFTHHHEQLNF